MYRLLARINILLLPSLTKQQLEISKTTQWQKILLAWRYFVTIRALK